MSARVPPTPHRERLPSRGLELLDPAALLAFCEDVQDDLASVRTLLHETLAALAQVTADRDRLRRILKAKNP